MKNHSVEWREAEGIMQPQNQTLGENLNRGINPQFHILRKSWEDQGRRKGFGLDSEITGNL